MPVNPNNLPKPGMTDAYRYFWNQTKSGWQKHGGQIMTIAGTAGLILTGVHACRKTYKIHDKLKENGERISKAKEYLDDEGKLKHATRVVKETAKVAAKTSVNYIGDAIVGGACAFLVHKGWSKEHTNYQAAVAMGALVMSDFMNYRNNVIAEQGAEADRKYLTAKRETKAYISDGKEKADDSDVNSPIGEEHVIQLHENDLRIWFSRETTPQVWSDSLAIRKARLYDIQNRLNHDLIYGGSYTINDVRREFYGRQGDIGIGGMYGRIWDPGDPEHPERGAYVNLHFEEDENFMTGRTEGCYIIIDIDPEPLFELITRKRNLELAGDIL